MSHTPIDLRSDTVTLPSLAMRQAMSAAQVGDDVYGEDPTVNELEALAASVIGKEAALYVPSGTMGNLIAIMTHCRRGEAVILGELAHIFLYEAGGASRLNGSPFITVPNRPDGNLDASALEHAFIGDDIHEARAGLLCIENTQNRCGGRVLDAATVAGYATLAHNHHIPLHIDGARIFNAAIALGTPARELAAPADSIMFCLSKGLAAPVGSLLAGSADFIAEARRHRKLLGGGMRQAGIIAAAGIVALREMIDRLAEDHVNAQRLAEGLAGIPGIILDPESVVTNILFFSVDPAHASGHNEGSVAEAASAQGILIDAIPGIPIRAVTHYGITASDIDRVVDVVRKILG
jgi:threonine aldolase